MADTAAKKREGLIALLKLAPSTVGFTDAEVADWVDRNVEITDDGSMRVTSETLRRIAGDSLRHKAAS